MYWKIISVPIVTSALLFATATSAEMTAAEMKQIDKGFKVFTKEKFDGNGRTCATCHIPGESYNIFPSTIKKMSRREKRLVFATNVPGLENVDLIKSHALFNTSGGADTCPADSPSCFGTPGEEHSGPIFRSTMGIFATDLTSVNTAPGFPGTPLFDADCSTGVAAQLPQLGWAGDGAPGTPNPADHCTSHHGSPDPDADGSLRAFANGAIAQHNTRSLNRTLGVDFRFATDDELDAMDALQKWLGRRALTDEENTIQGTIDASEFDINLLAFTDARVALGRDFYAGPPELAPPPGPPGGGPPPPPVINADAGAGCNGCHVDGGSNPGFPAGGGNNINLNTEVELASAGIGMAVVGAPLPHDEGAAVSFGPPTRPPAFQEAFNVQSIIESAQKKAWFHNHRVVDNFEESIAFYGSPDFVLNAAIHTPLSTLQNGNINQSIAFPNGDGIEHLGAFLRSLNAFYNLRNCERLIDEAIARVKAGVKPRIAIKHCKFDLKNTRRILKKSKLPYLHTKVIYGTKFARKALNRAGRNVYKLTKIRNYIRELRDSIATQTEAL